MPRLLGRHHLSEKSPVLTPGATPGRLKESAPSYPVTPGHKDADTMIRPVCDALTIAGVIKDDAQVVSARRPDSVPPRRVSASEEHSPTNCVGRVGVSLLRRTCDRHATDAVRSWQGARPLRPLIWSVSDYNL